MNMIVIYYLSFHFSILYTKHTWWEIQIFSISPFKEIEKKISPSKNDKKK